MSDEQVPICRADYDVLSPRDKGYASYMYSHWPNSEIPKSSPYVAGSPEDDEFKAGEFAGIIHAMESES